MTSPADADTGLDLSVFAQLGVSLDSVRDELRASRLEQRRRAAEIWPINIQLPTWNGQGTYDLGAPSMGPMDGYCWAMHRISVATFTAGTVNMYKGIPADNNLLFAFTQAGAFWSGRANFVLLPKDRLTFAAATGAPITGNVTISMDATNMATSRLPDFLD